MAQSIISSTKVFAAIDSGDAKCGSITKIFLSSTELEKAKI